MKTEPADIKVEPEEEIPVEMKEMKEEDNLQDDAGEMKEERDIVEDKKVLEFLFKSMDCIAAMKDENEVQPGIKAEKELIDPKKTLEKKKFSVGDLVFAKMKGYPVWPARVSSIISEKPSCLRYSVYFFGTHNSAICTEKNVFAYDEETKAKYGKPLKYRGFQQALDEIKEAASVLEQESHQSLEEDPVMQKKEKPPVCHQVKKEDTHPNDIHPGEVNSFRNDNLETPGPSLARDIAIQQLNERSSLEEQQFPCTVCGKASLSLLLCMEHRKSHERNKSLKCDMCCKAFFTKHALETHMQIHTFGKQNLFNVSELKTMVDEALESSRESAIKGENGENLMKKLSIEENTEEGKKREVLDCAASKKKSVGTHALGSKKLITGQGKKFVCNFCCKPFTQKGNLVKHLRTHTGERPYKCTVCRRGFAQSCNLKEHTRSHAKGKPYTCSVCQKRFTSQSGLSQHSHVHKVRRPFKCNVCNQQFSCSRYLKRHSHIHSDEQPFICSLCGRGFTQQFALKQHTRVHTGERPFNCNVCGKKFSQRGGLNRHCLIHSDEKPFICHLCGRRFRRKTHLNDHIFTHTGERPYCCNICKKCFITKHEVARHIQRKHV